jgi:hypothetical protein
LCSKIRARNISCAGAWRVGAPVIVIFSQPEIRLTDCPGVFVVVNSSAVADIAIFTHTSLLECRNCTAFIACGLFLLNSSLLLMGQILVVPSSGSPPILASFYPVIRGSGWLTWNNASGAFLLHHAHLTSRGSCRGLPS